MTVTRLVAPRGVSNPHPPPPPSSSRGVDNLRPPSNVSLHESQEGKRFPHSSPCTSSTLPPPPRGHSQRDTTPCRGVASASSPPSSFCHRSTTSLHPWKLLLLVLACGSVCPGECAVGEYEAEYSALLERVVDRSGLQAIKSLHQQLDDDNDGTIEPFETGDFIKADLKFDGDRRREKIFHDKDAEITVADLWTTWSQSEVYNWTVDQTVDWLSNNLDLPQYAHIFVEERINGSKLPLLATNDPSYLTKRLGITNPIHKSKISLKAMDVVLFGPPKEANNLFKDMIVATLLIALVSALGWAYQQKKRSEEQLSKMIKDMESLNKAEQMLQDMQARVDKAENSNNNQYNHLNSNSSTTTPGGDEEVGRLREEVEILRGELQRAEIELEDRCWVAPTILQHWLQLTYELECKFFNEKRRAAETQMEIAKDACEKLKRKRSSIVGAFVSTHGRSIDDVDKSILEAKTSLLELTHDLTERSRRWRQIEMLTGVSIISNPGLATLQKIVRYVGGGNKSSSVRSTAGGMSSRMSNMSLDELDDDARSLAASSHVSSHLSRTSKAPRHCTGPGSIAGGSTTDAAMMRRAAFEMSRGESSKESTSESDEGHHQGGAGAAGSQVTGGGGGKTLRELKSRISQTSMSSDISRFSHVSAASSYTMEVKSGASNTSPTTTDAAPRSDTPPPPSSTSSSIRRARMIKSLSHGEADTEDGLPPADKLTSSVSDGALNNHLPGSGGKGNGVGVLGNNKNNHSTLDEIEESCSASDSGSLCDLDGKKKKRKSFFNFRRKKEKVETIS